MSLLKGRANKKIDIGIFDKYANLEKKKLSFSISIIPKISLCK